MLLIARQNELLAEKDMEKLGSLGLGSLNVLRLANHFATHAD